MYWYFVVIFGTCWYLLEPCLAQVWVCLGSDNMALPMEALEDGEELVQQSLNFTQVLGLY